MYDRHLRIRLQVQERPQSLLRSGPAPPQLVGTYHFAYGIDCSSPAAIAAYFNTLVNEISKPTHASKGMQKDETLPASQTCCSQTRSYTHTPLGFARAQRRPDRIRALQAITARGNVCGPNLLLTNALLYTSLLLSPALLVHTRGTVQY